MDKNDKDNKNERKSKLILGMIFSIIVLLIVGIIYQFVYIKKLEKQIVDYEKTSSRPAPDDKNYITCFETLENVMRND